MNRIKTIHLDGAEYRICSMTMADAEQYLADQAEAIRIGAALPEDGLRLQKENNYRIVASCLNRAMEDGAKKIEPADVPKLLDLVAFGAIHKEILEFSGLKLANESETKPGEAVASQTP